MSLKADQLCLCLFFVGGCVDELGNEILSAISPHFSTPFLFLIKMPFYLFDSFSLLSGPTMETSLKPTLHRYFPSYELFSSTLTNISNKKSEAENSDSETSLWKGKGLRIVLGSDREVKGVEKF